jgi:hypothetical protein
LTKQGSKKVHAGLATSAVQQSTPATDRHIVTWRAVPQSCFGQKQLLPGSQKVGDDTWHMTQRMSAVRAWLRRSSLICSPCQEPRNTTKRVGVEGGHSPAGSLALALVLGCEPTKPKKTPPSPARPPDLGASYLGLKSGNRKPNQKLPPAAGGAFPHAHDPRLPQGSAQLR